MGDDSADSRRIDKWLWYARFFKTRALAATAVRGGKVHVGGVRVKPAREIRVGDRLDITRGVERFEVDVKGLGERRGPSLEAQALYRETEASQRNREAMRAAVAAANGMRSVSEHKPNKRERRQLERLRGR